MPWRGQEDVDFGGGLVGGSGFGRLGLGFGSLRHGGACLLLLEALMSSLRVFATVAFLGGLVPCTSAFAQRADGAVQSGSIVGQLTDPQGQSLKAGRAVVFLCDAETGMPFSAKTRASIAWGTDETFAFEGAWHAVTDDDGAFQFDEVPAGSYRLVAQSWAGVSGMAHGLPDGEGAQPSSILILHGVAEHVAVKAGERSLAYPRRQGNGVLRIVTDPEAPHNFVVFSARAPLGDGVLGPAAWGPDFVAGAIGVTRMEDSHLLVIGLAEGATVHVGLWNYDNNVGTGGGSYAVESGKSVRLPIYASWSNGRDDPPPHLVALTEHLETTGLELEKLIDMDRSMGYRGFIEATWKRANEMVDVEGFGQARLIDVLACDSYRELRKRHADQKAQRAARVQ
jgi:hypothetical protein